MQLLNTRIIYEKRKEDKKLKENKKQKSKHQIMIIRMVVGNNSNWEQLI